MNKRIRKKREKRALRIAKHMIVHMSQLSHEQLLQMSREANRLWPDGGGVISYIPSAAEISALSSRGGT